MSIISIILVVLVAFLAGMEGILDEFQFHQPLVACTLIGLVTGNLEAGIDSRNDCTVCAGINSNAAAGTAIRTPCKHTAMMCHISTLRMFPSSAAASIK